MKKMCLKKALPVLFLVLCVALFAVACAGGEEAIEERETQYVGQAAGEMASGMPEAPLQGEAEEKKQPEPAKPAESEPAEEGSTESIPTEKAEAPPATPEAAATMALEETPAAEIVYWVESGEVYHLSKGCRTLARSKDIKSGTAAESEKERACKVCGGQKE